MPNPRTPAPSRIGKTLGAILSNSRRGTPDSDDAESPAGLVEQGGEPVGVPLPPEQLAHPSAVQATDPEAIIPSDAAEPGPAGPATLAVDPPPSTPTLALAVAPAPVATATDSEQETGGARRKKRETFLVPEDLADAMRNAIVHLSGPPLYYTLAEFGEHAIRSYIAQLEREHNAGRPFPPRPRAVRQGRPLR